ncbi:unnamed protein product [Withania somnifera]
MAPYLVLLQRILLTLFLLSRHCLGVFPGENFNGGGFTLKPGQSMIFTAPVSFQGEIWGRTGCNFDKNGNGSCLTGDCGPFLKCSSTDKACLSELAIRNNGKVIACGSACDVFNTDEYRCRGNYGNPTTCQPTFYSKKFKEVCPTAYSYAYDDPTSIFTCSGTDYVIVFCSSRKKPVCTYHDHKLVCGGSIGLRSSISNLWMITLGLTLIANYKMIIF